MNNFAKTQVPEVLNDPTFTQPYDGITLGPFIEGWYHVIYYNKALADKIGLNIRASEMTSDDFLSYLQKIDQYNKTHQTKIAAIYDACDWVTLQILWKQLVKSEFGFTKGMEFPDSLTEQKKQVFYKVLKYFEKMSEYNPLIPSAKENQWNNTQDLVLNDQAIFYFNGTWMYNIWEQIDSIKVNKMIPCELPVFQTVKFYPGMFQSNYTVLKNSSRKQAAIKFMMFLATKDIAEDWVQLSKSPTGINRHFSNSTIGQDVYEQFVTKIGKKYKGKIDDLEIDWFGSQSTIYFDYLDLHKILFKEQTADEIYAKYINSYLADSGGNQ